MKFKNVLLIAPISGRKFKVNLKDIYEKNRKFLKHGKIPVVICKEEIFHVIGFLDKIAKVNKRGLIGSIEIKGYTISVETWIKGRNKNLIRQIVILPQITAAITRKEMVSEAKNGKSQNS